MNLIQQIPDGSLDIIGDIHGEYYALLNLLKHLGYDYAGNHPNGRTIVFVGDFCDRGPNSPAVLALIEQLIVAKRAVAVLGNHELNLLRAEAKDGSGWFFNERVERDNHKYSPYEKVEQLDREKIISFLLTLPIGLEREDLRVVHAAWMQDQVQILKSRSIGSQIQSYVEWDQLAHKHASDFLSLMKTELEDWNFSLEDQHNEPPFLHAHAAHDSVKQMMNPLRVLTSGVERKGGSPFYSSGKWRFSERVQWWDEYDGHVPVVIGHYWRRVEKIDRGPVGKGDPDLFAGTHPYAWHGKHNNVFCVDFSVGGRWVARKKSNLPETDFKLAALRWPEHTLCFDDGEEVETIGYQASINKVDDKDD